MRLRTVLIAAFALASGCARKEPEAKKNLLVTVKTVVAESMSVPLTLVAPATIFPREQANLAPRMTAAIQQLKAGKGASVTAGQPLVVLENRDVLAQVREAQGMLADAQATLLKTRGGTLPTDIQRAQGQVDTTAAALRQAASMYERRKSLFEQGAIPARDLLVSETELATAKSNAEVARKSLELLEQQSRGQEIRIAEARVEQAQGKLANASALLQYTEIRAPFSGTITEQFQYPGDLAQPSNPVFTLMDLSLVTARAQVPETQAPRVHLGQACTFRSVEDSSERVAGKVTVINRAVDLQRRTVEVWCEIQRPPLSLRAGVFGAVAFETGIVKDAVVVPASAVQLEEGSSKGVLMVIEGGQTARRRDVETAPAGEGKLLIRSGLKAGERVIVEGGYEMPDGTKVIADPPAKSEKEAPAKEGSEK